MNHARPIFAAVLAGQLHAVSMIDSPLWIFLAVPLLFFALQSTSPRIAMVLGGLYAALSGMEVLDAQSYGLFAVSVMFANLVLFGVGLGAGLAYISRRLTGVSVPFLSALMLVFWEQFFRIATGAFYVPVSLGNALAGSTLWAQSAVFGGSPLLSLLLAYFGSSLYAAYRHRSERVAALGVASAMLVPAWMALYGFLQLHAPSSSSEEERTHDPFRVRIVQGAVPTWTYEILPFVPVVEDEIFEHYAALSRTSSSNSKIDLFIWPETVLRPSVRSQSHVFQRVQALSRELSTWFIVGSAYYDSPNEPPINGALSFLPDGELRQGGKRWLVPLLENEWQARNQAIIFESERWRVGVVICVESLYPSLFDAFAGQNLDAVIVLVNDAGLGAGLREIHARRSSLRAIEMGVPVIHAAQYYDTRVFDAQGQEITRASGSNAQSIDVALPIQ